MYVFLYNLYLFIFCCNSLKNTKQNEILTFNIRLIYLCLDKGIIFSDLHVIRKRYLLILVCHDGYITSDLSSYSVIIGPLPTSKNMTKKLNNALISKHTASLHVIKCVNFTSFLIRSANATTDRKIYTVYFTRSCMTIHHLGSSRQFNIMKSKVKVFSTFIDRFPAFLLVIYTCPSIFMRKIGLLY